MHQNGTIVAFSNPSQTPSTHCPHKVPQPLSPRRRLCREDAGPSEGTSLWCRDGLGLEGICPEQTEGIAHPVCHLLLYLWSKNKLHLHLQSNWPNHYSSPTLLKGKREKLQISFITLEGHSIWCLSTRAPGSVWPGPFSTSLVAKNLSSLSLASPTCYSVGVEAPCPRAGSSLTKL